MPEKLTAEEVISALEGLELKALKEVYSATQGQIKLKEKAAQGDAIQRMRDIAEQKGVDFEAVMRAHFGIDETSDGQKKRAKVPPKYKHPENPSLTWSGRGRHPTWFKEYVEAGGSSDDLLIEKKTEAAHS